LLGCPTSGTDGGSTREFSGLMKFAYCPRLLSVTLEPLYGFESLKFPLPDTL
jgi:hypothetical protein